MTYDAFLATLREITDWQLAVGPWPCDIGVIYRPPQNQHRCVWIAAAQHLGLEPSDYNIFRDGERMNEAIWHANDNRQPDGDDPGHDPAIRQDLLRACGLEIPEGGDHA